ncbi:MAG: 23S rRNA (adenine(2503)-C(2))-methyltransferase [Chloroflexi bacterium RBG_16_56_8]|nr:MAG: 23S rRNA (adenine(2503)-C(2))-methyltransferase [Chloroflexi bacterium RBG_16_56_8]
MTDLLNLTNAQMRELFVEWGEPAYRADQVDRWIYKELATDFDAMTDLPQSLRKRLAESATIGVPQTLTETISADKLVRKALLSLSDGQTIETVLMLYPDAPGSPELEEPHSAPRNFSRRTVCISTQVGCPIGCPFCATGQAGYIRNLTPGEIIAQVLHMARIASPITNVVLMGMGEPFMKFDVTWQAIQSLVDPARFGLGARRITVSTSGEVPGIERMTQEKLQVNLAISLHAPDDELRNQLVPLNRKYPLKDLLRAVRGYVEQTRRRVTFEYALMDNVNDRPEQARTLSQMLKGLLCHVNLIPLNPTARSPYGRTPYDRVKKFERILSDAGIPTTLRVEKGIEIAAGCGQLKQASQKLKVTS